MERRSFLQATLAAPALTILPSTVREALAQAAADGWRTYEVITKLEVFASDGVSKAWVPLPYTAKTDWHNPLGNNWSGNGQMKVVTDGKYGAEMLYVEWQPSVRAPVAEITSRFAEAMLDMGAEFDKQRVMKGLMSYYAKAA